MTDYTILIRYGEIHLKGHNRPFFERKLVKNIQNALKEYENIRVLHMQGRFFVEGYEKADEANILQLFTKVFWIESISPAVICEKEWSAICEHSFELMRTQVQKHGGSCTFKVIPRRSDKRFPLNSMTMAPELGGLILENVPGTIVDIHNYQVALGVEVRERVYLYCEIIPGSAGLPTGCNGKVALLLSGGIDSPVAGHMMMKRGLELECVHFHSFPYTSERAKQKVIDLAAILAGFAGKVRLHIVPITEFQLAVYEKCPETLTTILLRRGMMQIAERIAKNNDCQALVTGESVGQVASQTLESLACTDETVSMPVFRPCIGFDKSEIVDRALAIDSYETSILPFEDCCTIFTPKHPATKPQLKKVLDAQSKLEQWRELIDKSFNETETQMVYPRVN